MIAETGPVRTCAQGFIMQNHTAYLITPIVKSNKIYLFKDVAARRSAIKIPAIWREFLSFF